MFCIQKNIYDIQNRNLNYFLYQNRNYGLRVFENETFILFTQLNLQSTNVNASEDHAKSIILIYLCIRKV